MAHNGSKEVRRTKLIVLWIFFVLTTLALGAFVGYTRPTKDKGVAEEIVLPPARTETGIKLVNLIETRSDFGNDGTEVRNVKTINVSAYWRTIEVLLEGETNSGTVNWIRTVSRLGPSRLAYAYDLKSAQISNGRLMVPLILNTFWPNLLKAVGALWLIGLASALFWSFRPEGLLNAVAGIAAAAALILTVLFGLLSLIL